MKRRNFIKSSICLGCAGAFGMNVPLVMAEDYKFTRREKLAMKKFIYKSVDELPKEIRVDVCNLCQLNCPECWVRKSEEIIKNEGSGFGYTSFEQFKDFVDKHSFLRLIEISANGECLLNPDIDKIIEYAYKKNILLTAGTGVNLNTLSEKTAENLVKYKFQVMTVSIDGASPETYSIYRRGGDFNTVINNIKLINKYKKKYNSEFPYLTYKFVVFGHNEHEIEKAKDLAYKLRMNIMFSYNVASDYSPVKNPQKVFQQTGLYYSPKIVDNNFENLQKGYDDFFYCNDLFNRPQINFDGEILGCCANFIHSFGVNVFKDGMLKALNNKRILYAKLMLSDLNYKPLLGLRCDNCQKYKLLVNSNSPININNFKKQG